MKNVLFIFLLTFTLSSFSQVSTFYVQPIETNINYEAVQDSHMIVQNLSTSNGKLFLFLGGTLSSTFVYRRMSEFSAELGFDVINLAYINTIPAPVFGNNTNNLAFDNYRQHVCYGTDLTFLQIDSLNSIYSRTLNLLNHLDANFPDQNWDQYIIDGTSINWENIIVGGHSQGSGHAAYFGKFEDADRVLMFAGPNDYSVFFDRPGSWLSNEGVTPINKYFAYLHLFDNVVDFSDQFSNIEALGIFPRYDTISVEQAITPFENSRCLIIQDTTGFVSPHSKPVARNTLNEEVWTYMLTSDIISNTQEVDNKNIALLFPNPTNTKLTVEIKSDWLDKKYSIINAQGQIVHTGKIEASLLEIDVSSLSAGVYFFKTETEALKFIKQ